MQILQKQKGRGGLPWQLVFTCPQKEFTCRLPRCQEGTLPTTDFKEELAGFSTDEYLASELYHKIGYGGHLRWLNRFLNTTLYLQLIQTQDVTEKVRPRKVVIHKNLIQVNRISLVKMAGSRAGA